ncbi:acyl-CoA-like ligand-binding transcription factor, partial [Streptomyces acidiscabies]
AEDDTGFEPVRRVCDAARLVLRMYAENPSFSVQRYRLTKRVPGLRAYELSVVWRYERALAEYLRQRFAGLPDGILRADVIAAAVVAAHNNALRSWLRSDGAGDASAMVDHALEYVQSTYSSPSPSAAPVAEHPEDVVVVVSRRGAPLWRVVQEIETTLGRS